MSNGEDTGTLRIVAVLFAIVFVSDGLAFMIVPHFAWSLGEVPGVGEAGLFRWSGAWLTAVGFGGFLLSRDPVKQGALITTLAVGTLLALLSFIYIWASGEYQGATWFIALPVVLVGGFTILFWWLRSKHKAIL